MAPASEENQSMLLDHSVNYIKAASDKRIDEDTKINDNNNNNNENSALDERNLSPRYSSNSKGVFAQCMVTGAVLILAAGAGMPIGYSAILLPQLAEDNGTMHVDAELGSWIASIHSLSTPVGSLLSGPLLESFGRRGNLQISTIPFIIGWIIMGFATNISYIIVGRIICGLGVGLVAVPAQILVAEMADPGLRGFLVGGSFVAYSFGILLTYAFGASFAWNIVAFIGTVLPVFALIALTFIPESPVWLVRRKKIKRARKALLWLRGGDREQADTEIAILEARMKADNAKKRPATSFGQQASSAVSMILNPGVLKPLIIINVLNALQLTSGTYIIVFYAVDLVKDISGDSIDSYMAAVYTALSRFFFTLVSCVLLLKMGRRTLFIASAIGTALPCLAIAAYMLARREESYIDSYILGICLLTYVAANTVGLLQMPILTASELLPQRARGFGGGFNFFLYNSFLFVVTKFFPMINEAVGIIGLFTIFGISGLLAAVLIYLALPETKNFTLEEIEDYFTQDNVLWVTKTKHRGEAVIVTTS